jgi:GNAT superfamily N-acetyltransferase
MKNIEIRQATEIDIPILEGILLDTVNWLNEMGQPLWGADDVKWDALSKKHQISDFYIAYADGVPSGCMALIDYDPFFWPDVKKGESLFMHKLAVTKNARKTGVADALVNYFKKQGKIHGISVIRLDTHAWRPKTRAFYERHGFVSVGIKICESDPRKNTALYIYTPITIRLAVPVDAPDMAEVHMRSWDATYKGIMPDDFIREKNATRPELYKRVITDENKNTYVIQYNGKTVGIMCVAPPQDKELTDCCELHYIYLHPDYFRQGVGSQAMKFAYEIARNDGKTGMVLWVLEKNEGSIKFYEKCGFIADGHSYEKNFDKPLRSIRMRRSLQNG